MKAKIGIIGGSGIDELEELRGAQWKSVPSPFGNTSDKLLFGEINSGPNINDIRTTIKKTVPLRNHFFVLVNLVIYSTK